MKNRIVIIDGNSLINRAYYAMQKPMITKEGIYTQGIFGFLNMLNRILDDYDPDYMAVAWDMRAPTFRHEAYKDYKAGRRKMPAELAMELAVKGMVPDTTIGRKALTRLHVYSGSEYAQVAQKPEKFEF